jgi:hypothetical protein
MFGLAPIVIAQARDLPFAVNYDALARRLRREY